MGALSRIGSSVGATKSFAPGGQVSAIGAVRPLGVAIALVLELGLLLVLVITGGGPPV